MDTYELQRISTRAGEKTERLIFNNYFLILLVLLSQKYKDELWGPIGNALPGVDIFYKRHPMEIPTYSTLIIPGRRVA